ncbi:PLD nuclease N-terminal domain-containing protein [Streptomyces sp. NPDC007818]|uniref:PLD nuclease N-terminal domain-containing protein n=1 Tax=Streptomyces sp. NPDC007818 TaxID=3364780 RepID=UPI00368F445D
MLRALMILLPLALTIYAFIDCLNTPEDEVKHLPKVVWVVIILLAWVVGPVVWLAAGKKRQTAGGAFGGFGGRGGRSGGWVAPDDNPEFLKSLSEEKPKEKREKPEGKDGTERDDALFEDGEADPRRREEELKRREDGDEEKGA